MTDTGSGAHPMDTSKPHSARMYDYFLGGKDNYPVDVAAAEQVTSLFPAVSAMARTNRAFMHRASRLLAERGVRQFLDIGTGIPTRPNLHQIVQGIAPRPGWCTRTTTRSSCATPRRCCTARRRGGRRTSRAM